MKRKQVNLTESELGIITDALSTQSWFRYDPNLEPSVSLNHKLYHRLNSVLSTFNDEATTKANP